MAPHVITLCTGDATMSGREQMNARVRALAFAAAVGLASITGGPLLAQSDQQPAAPADAQAPAAQAPAAPAPAAPPAAAPAPQAAIATPADPVAKAAFEVLDKHCARCHQDGKLSS